MEFVLEQGKQHHKECSNLVLPALSIGNVGQLALDLLISTTEAERVGYLDDPFILPCVGNDAYGPIPQGNLALPAEVYDSASNSLTLLQQRSPVIKGMLLEYAKNLADHVASSGIMHVVLLSGLDFGKWRNIDISSGSQIFYLSSTTNDGADEHCEGLGFKRLKEYNPDQKHWRYLNAVAQASLTQSLSLPLEDDLDDDEVGEGGDYYAGLPFAALFTFLKAKGVKVTCLLCYCSEGDNMPDAFHLAEGACKLLTLNPRNVLGSEGNNWLVPFSWKTVYGPPPDLSMF